MSESSQQTALHEAALQGDLKMVQTIRQLGARNDIKDNENMVPADHARKEQIKAAINAPIAKSSTPVTTTAAVASVTVSDKASTLPRKQQHSVDVLVAWMASLNIGADDANNYATTLVANGYETIDSLADIDDSEWVAYVPKPGHVKRLKAGNRFTDANATPVPSAPRLSQSGNYSTFLSHYKVEGGDAARLIKDRLSVLLKPEPFLDSDHLRDVRNLVKLVMESETLTLLQTQNVLHRPWCLVELYTAIKNRIPIVTVNIQHKMYDYAIAKDFLERLDVLLEPHHVQVLQDNGFDVTDVAYELSQVIPWIISIEVNPHASDLILQAQIQTLKEAIVTATPPPPPNRTKEEWLKSRSI
eukprot:c6233_g1_i1.p1 GENE.c6233_g1_i1~~c6233_g1_i1.p1  ORF type:complete len:358 (-),score=93.37 c6233_g1_i1:21-1094(-)